MKTEAEKQSQISKFLNWCDGQTVCAFSEDRERSEVLELGDLVVRAGELRVPHITLLLPRGRFSGMVFVFADCPLRRLDLDAEARLQQLRRVGYHSAIVYDWMQAASALGNYLNAPKGAL